MTKTLVEGYWYTVTTATTCDVTDANGKPLGTATAGSQLSFKASTAEITFSDPDASVLVNLNPGIIRFREGDLQGETSQSQTALGVNAESSRYGAAVGGDARAGGESVAVGDSALADTDEDTSFGSVAVGFNVNCDNEAVAIGSYSSAYDGGVAIGSRTSIEGNGVAVGNGASTRAGGIVLAAANTATRGTSGTVCFGFSNVDRSGNITGVYRLVFAAPGAASTFFPSGSGGIRFQSVDTSGVIIDRSGTWEQVLPTDNLVATAALDDDAPLPDLSFFTEAAAILGRPMKEVMAESSAALRAESEARRLAKMNKQPQ